MIDETARRLLPTAAEGQEYGHLVCCESSMGARHCIICRSQCPLRIQQSEEIHLASDVKPFGLLLRLRRTSLRCSKVAIALQIATVGGQRTFSIPKRREYHAVEAGQDELLGSAGLGNPRASQGLVRMPMDGQPDTEAVRRRSQEVFGRAG